MRRKGLRFSNLSTGLIRKFISRQEEPSEEQVNACIAYRDFLISIGLETPQRTASFDEEKIVHLFAEHFLAKSNEN